MTHYPEFIRSLLSTSQYGSFEPYEDPAELAVNWPMNGDREWAVHCIEWLDSLLAKEPSPEEAFRLIFSGWHNCDLLVREDDFTQLLYGIRAKLLRELPDWKHQHYVTYLFEHGAETEITEPTLEYFVEPFNPRPHFDIPDLFFASYFARYALECREKPELLDRIIAELESVLFNCRSDEEIDRVWSYTGVAYTFSKGGIRRMLTLALGAFETAKLSMSVQMRRERKFRQRQDQ
jgi:hypothetical protein